MPPQTATHQYPSHRRSVPRARTALHHQLTRWHIHGELAHTAELLLSELATNAVNAKTLPGREIQVAFQLSDTELRLEVADASEELPELRYGCAADEGGRGLVLVEALAGAWGVKERDGVGKVVWAVLNLEEAP